MQLRQPLQSGETFRNVPLNAKNMGVYKMKIEAKNYQSSLLGEYQRNNQRRLDDCAELEDHVLDTIFAFSSTQKEEQLVHYLISRARAGREKALQRYLN